MTINTTVVL